MPGSGYTKLPQELADENKSERTASGLTLNDKCYELNDVNDDELLRYDTRLKKPLGSKDVRKYKIVRYFFMTLIIKLIISLLCLSLYLCFTCECINKNLKVICHEGYCYDLNVESFEDSNGDGIGDFRGLKSQLKHFRDIGVESVFVNLHTIMPQKYNDFSSFVEMVKEGKKVGVSVLVKIEDDPSKIDLELIKKIKPYAGGFILDGQKSYEPLREFFKTTNCYLAKSGLVNFTEKTPFCKGTIYTIDGNYMNNFQQYVKTISEAKTKPDNLNVIGLINLRLDGKTTPLREFLLSLSLLSFTNGSILIKSGSELTKPLRLNYSKIRNKSDTTENSVSEAMKSLYELRKYLPRIGQNSSMSSNKVKGVDNCFVISKLINGNKITLYIHMFMNIGKTRQVFKISDAVSIDNTDNINIELTLPKTKNLFNEKTKTLTLDPYSAAIVSVQKIIV